LLQNVPSVQVDVDGNVSLRGSPECASSYQTETSPLLGSNIADALQQIPASSVEKIEVITNPSAKFTPEGTAGYYQYRFEERDKPRFQRERER